MNDKLLQILFSPEQAQIIELSLAGDKHKHMRYLLSRIGACLVTKQARVIAITEKELWYLRDHIDLTISVGETLALDVIVNVYHVLCKYYDIPLEAVEYIPYEPEKLQIIVMEEDDASRSSSESSDKTRDSTEGAATA